MYIVLPHEQDERWVTALTGVLGSRICAFYVKGWFDEVNDAFPQLKVGQLKNMPLPIEALSNERNREAVDDLISLVREIGKVQAAAGGSRTAGRRRKKAERRLDEVVLGLYGLKPADAEVVLGFYNRYSK